MHVSILAVALRVGSMQMKLLVALTSLLASKRLMKSLKDIMLKQVLGPEILLPMGCMKLGN